MESSTTAPSEEASVSCPFCGRQFLRLGNHLPHCKQRQGQDYSQYLSHKTLQKRSKKSCRKTCPKCHKPFLRLDTHLKNSAFCKSIPSDESPDTSPSNQEANPESTRPSETHTNSPDQATPQADEELRRTSPLPTLQLPSSQEAWVAADCHFSANLLPAVMNASTVEEKNTMLTTGIYQYFAESCGTRKVGQKQGTQQKKQKQHDRALKKVTELKKKAKKDFREAKLNGMTPEGTQTLARNFFYLVRQQSKLKRKSKQAGEYASTRRARQQCHRHFWRFARDLLDENQASQVDPQFSEEQACEFFTNTYKSQPCGFEQPSWMPSANPPSTPFDDDPISLAEIQAVIKRSTSASTPSPFDQIPYQIFKRCPSLSEALLDLFQSCWSTSIAPSSWKVAGIKLIGKASAVEHPESPSNFRPIALTSCVGKLFTTILKNRWLEFMLVNKYLDRSIQKAFMTATPGCIEHQSKLAAILHDAKKKHKSLTVCWLDLANAYGSVHHSLIDYSLRHYHAPSAFCSMVQGLYGGLSASVITKEWSTPAIPLQIGVYQGDPLSVVVFNTVINTLVDTLRRRSDLGYDLTPSHTVGLLQYADDTCITANSPAACQHLLNMTDQWLLWSRMKVKVPKCHSLAIKSSSAEVVDPHLTISNAAIPFIGSSTISFLGRKIQVPQDKAAAKRELKTKLERMLQLVDQAQVTRHQKLKLYRQGIP